jgi:hypothetical protein
MIYGDIDNSYVTTGDGSIGNPINWGQFVTAYTSAATATIFYLKGKRNLSAGITISNLTAPSIEIYSWSPSTNGPFIINMTNSGDNLLSLSVSVGPLLIKNMAFGDTIGDLILSSDTADVDVLDSYINCKSIEADSYSSGIYRFKGCTLKATDVPGFFYVFGTNLEFLDCAIDIPGISSGGR